jgi:deoxycytidylate deaminase
MKIKPHILAKAVLVARKSDVERGKIGAVLFLDNGHIITSACNRSLTGCVPRTIHAEQFLLQKANKLCALERFGRANLNVLIVRIRANDELATAKPCTSCQALLRNTGMQNIYYSHCENGGLPRLIKL